VVSPTLNPLESPFGKRGTSRIGIDGVCRGAKPLCRGLGCRQILYSPPKIGGQGVDTDWARVSQQNDPSSRASNHILADVKKER
jgi:hypothetical protein